MAATPVSGSTLPDGRVSQTVPRPRGRPRGSRTRYSFGTPLSSRANRSHHATVQRAARAQRQQDHYKPREERSYKEFHRDLDVEATLQVFSSNEVDGIQADEEQEGGGGLAKDGETGDRGLGDQQSSTNGNGDDAEKMNVDSASGVDTASPVVGGGGDAEGENADGQGSEMAATTTVSENGISASQTGVSSPASFNNEMVDANAPDSTRRGRLLKRPPPTPKPKPARTPKKPLLPPPPQQGNNIHDHERLSLPVPSFRTIKPFDMGVAYIDRAMAGVGFQDSDYWQRPAVMVRSLAVPNVGEESDLRISSDKSSNTVKVEPKASSTGPTVGQVEYDMDEQDDRWLISHNKSRAERNVPPISREIFEITITKIEKEWHALQKRIPKPTMSTAASKNKDGEGDETEDADSKCWICDDGECENSNAIVFCDGCDLAVHQDCYGVPFIPEGQWLCRKCQLLSPRQTADCIFCPNTDGAFKQTVSAKWCHLLCALWIPEVSIQNMTFMEPVEGVERVPKQRWKLMCYICKQKMGACIQCSNKNCFLAFHVTCARRAKLFLKMKTHGPGTAIVPGESRALLEQSQLKAFCDKHVPLDWKKDYNTEQAFDDAIEYYRTKMANKSWGDSQAWATSLPNSTPQTPFPNSGEHSGLTPLKLKLTLNAGKRKRITSSKNRIVWKLPSGAPVVPNILYNTVVQTLQRYTVRSSKEYAAEVCKYWTLKREARRDASLLKRLQLANQAEAFTSNEVTRKNYAAMGPDGKAKLQRRIEFAIKLRHDLERLRLLCDDVKKREREKLKNAECMREMVDVVYFPITTLVRPALERAQQLDSKDQFHQGLSKMWKRLLDREYNTVAQFQKDLDETLEPALAKHNKDKSSHDTALPDQPLTPAATGPLTPSTVVPPILPPLAITREKADRGGGHAYATATRILKTVQPILDDAREKERQLREDPYERAAYESEDRAIQKRRRRESLIEMEATATPYSDAAGEVPPDVTDKNDHGNQMEVDTVLIHADAPAEDDPEKRVITPNHPRSGTPSNNNVDDDPGIIGLPWYTTPFSPKGTSLLIEERWMGPEVMREMSPLSEIDEDQLEDLTKSPQREDMMEDSPVAEESTRSESKASSQRSKASRPKSASRSKSKSKSKSKSAKASSRPIIPPSLLPSRGTRSAAKAAAKKRAKSHKGYTYIVVDDDGNEVEGAAPIGDPLADGWDDLEAYEAPKTPKTPIITYGRRGSAASRTHTSIAPPEPSKPPIVDDDDDDDDTNASITVAHSTSFPTRPTPVTNGDDTGVGDDSMESRMSRILEEDDDGSDISSAPSEDEEEDQALLEQMDIDGQLANEMSASNDKTGDGKNKVDGEMEEIRATAPTADTNEDVELKDADDDSGTGESSETVDNEEMEEGEGDATTNGHATSPETDEPSSSSGSDDDDDEADDDDESSTDGTDGKESNGVDEDEDVASPATDSTAFHTPSEEPLLGSRNRGKASSRALSTSTANFNIDETHERDRSENGENAPPPDSSERGSSRKAGRPRSAGLSPSTPTKITLATPTPPTTRSRKKQEMPPSSNTRSGTKPSSKSSPPSRRR